MKNLQNGFVIPLIIAIVVISAIGGGTYIYVKDSLSKHNATTTPKVIVGNDRDAYGCVGSAGYSWCEVKNKCLRSWEEKCGTVSEMATSTDGQIVNLKTYRNTQYSFEIKYPKDWYYKEFVPTYVTTNFQTYDTLTGKYKKAFIKEMTDYVVAFGASNILMPTPTRGGDGFITIKISNGTMEDLFNQKITRDAFLNKQISLGEIKLEDARKDFFGERIKINGIEGYKVISRGQIPDALTDFPIEVVYIEKDGKVISIDMENVNNGLGISDVYEGILSTLKLTK